MFLEHSKNAKRRVLAGACVAAIAVFLSAPSAGAAEPHTIWCQPDSHHSKPTIAVAPDGSVVASAGLSDTGDVNIKIWDAQTGAFQREITAAPGLPEWVTISATGYVAVGIDVGHGFVAVYDIATGEFVLNISNSTGHLPDAKFLKDGKILAVADSDFVIRTYLIPEGIVVRNYLLHPVAGTNPDSVALSPDGTMIAFGGYLGQGDPNVEIHAFPEGGLLHRYLTQSYNYILETRFSHDSTRLGFTGTEGVLRILDTEGWELVAEIEAVDGADDFDFSPDDKLVLWGVNPNGSPRAAKVIRLDTQAVIGSYSSFSLANNAEYLPDGSGFARGGVDQGLCVYENEFQWITADIDGDNHVDLDDYAVFADCMTGPGETLEHGCEWSDLDADNDVDLQDYMRFVRWLLG